LGRHDGTRTIPPTNVNNRANITALKEHRVYAYSCHYGLREEIDRGDFVILDQFIDFTHLRTLSFDDKFPDGGRHTHMADPFNEDIRWAMITAARDLDISHHEKGTVVTIEGNRFSTKVESHMFRICGADVINVSIASECVLANEAGTSCAAVAMSTDYDCWKEDEAPVTWEDIPAVLSANVEKVTKLLVSIILYLKVTE